MNEWMDGWILDKIRVLHMNEWIQFGRETSVSSVDKQVQMTVILKTREPIRKLGGRKGELK